MSQVVTLYSIHEKKAQLREPLPRGNKIPFKVVTTLKKTVRIKQPSTSPSYSASFSKDMEGDKKCRI